MRRAPGRVLVLGCGSVAQCTVPLLVRDLGIEAEEKLWGIPVVSTIKREIVDDVAGASRRSVYVFSPQNYLGVFFLLAWRCFRLSKLCLQKTEIGLLAFVLCIQYGINIFIATPFVSDTIVFSVLGIALARLDQASAPLEGLQQA